MLGLFDFRDSLKDLFLDNLPLRRKPLSSLKGSQMALDSRSLVAHIHTIKQILNFKSNVGKFKAVLQKHDIEMVFFENAIDVVDFPALIAPCQKFIKFIEAYFYAVMIYELLEHEDLKAQAKFKDFIQSLACFRKDSVTAHVIAVRYQFNIRNVMRSLGIRTVISPQLREAQMSYFLAERPNRCLMSYPVAFLFSNETQIINLIDLETESYSYFDLEDFAACYKCTPQTIRKCLFGCLIYFNCHPEMRRQNKLLEALNEGFDNFPKAYNSRFEKRKKKIDQLLRFFLSKISNDRIDKFFAKQITCHFDFDPNLVREFFGMFRSSLCIADDMALVPFPSPVFLQSPSRLSLQLPTKEMHQLYCRGLLSDDLAKIFNRNGKQTLVFFFACYDNVELLYSYRAFYKSALEYCVAVLKRFLQLNVNQSFRIDYNRNQIDILDISKTKLPFDVSSPESSEPLSFGHALSRLEHCAINPLSETPTVPCESVTSTKILNYLNLNLFHYLEYVDLNESALYVPGHVMMTTEPKVHEQNFQEELLIIFELIRNNFLKPATFNVQNHFMSKNVPNLNDQFISLLVKRFVQKKEFSIRESKLVSPVPKSAETITADSSFYSEDRETEPEKIYDDPEILSGYERHLMAVQKAIKDFQKEFVVHLDMGYPISDFDEVITGALAGNQLNKIMLISRFYLFAITDFSIDDFYDQDTYQFREIVMIIIKSINAINTTSLVALLKTTGNLDNYHLASDINAKMPFCKNYSLDACTFIKVLLTQFLIFKALKAESHPLTKTYLRHIKAKQLQAAFKVKAEFCKFIETGRCLFKQSFIMVKALQKFVKDDFTTSICQEMCDTYPLLKQFCDFAVKIQPD
jgi:hypothetical protein